MNALPARVELADMDLPDVGAARLPEAYETARRALAECSRVDECQQWADKAEAMASYAKQSKDQALRQMADRIQARAIRRCGELLRQIEPQQGGDRGSGPTGGRPPVGGSRTSAATDAGLSEHQRKTALRVANVPEDKFEAAVESAHPPTVTALAKQGQATKPILNLGGAKPANFAHATQALAQLRRFAEFAAANDPVEVASGVHETEVSMVRQHVKAIDSWLDRFITSL
jgi:hypothetical protein